MTHNIDNVATISSTTPTEKVDDHLLVPQDDPNRPAVYASGDLYTFLATTRETDFDFNVFDFFVPVTGGPPAHVHTFEHEVWFVDAGKFQFNLGNQGTDNVILPEDSLVFGPRDRTHSSRNVESTASVSGVTPGARTFVMTTPGALDLFFDAVSMQVVDRDAPIPSFSASTDEGFISLLNQAKFAARTDTRVLFEELGLPPNYEPPEDVLDYVVVLPEGAEEEEVESALALSKLDGFDVWTTDEQVELPKRPVFTGDFGIEYTSLLNQEETGEEFSYNQFSLQPHASETNTNNFPEPIVSENHEMFFVNEGQLSLKIEGEVKTAEKGTYVYVPPGKEYSIANFGDEVLDALAVTVVDRPSPWPTADEVFPSPLNPQENLSADDTVFLGSEADFFDATDSDRGRRIYGDQGNDEFLVNTESRVFGEDGEDVLDATSGMGHNLLDGGNNNDILLAGSSDRLVGGNGNDLLYIDRGMNNQLYGGSGKDQFKIANHELPNTSEVQYPEDINSLLPEDLSLPDLVDTKNTIMDFELGTDKIYITGIESISSFEDLQLLPAFEDLGSTSITAEFTEEGIEKEISLANVSGIVFNELSTDDFVFG